MKYANHVQSIFHMCRYLQGTGINRYTKRINTDVAVRFFHMDAIYKIYIYTHIYLKFIVVLLLSQTHCLCEFNNSMEFTNFLTTVNCKCIKKII